MLIKLWICLETSLSSRFMSIVLWIRMTHLVPNACCGWGAWCHSLCFEAFLSLMSSLLIRLPWWLRGKASVCSAGDPGLSPGSGRSPGEGNANPLQYSCLEDSVGYHPWGGKKSDTTERLHFHFSLFNRYITSCSKQTRVHSFCRLPMSVRSFFYLFHTLIKLYYTKAQAIKPCHWPWIEFLSAGQESWRHSWLIGTTFQYWLKMKHFMAWLQSGHQAVRLFPLGQLQYL